MITEAENCLSKAHTNVQEALVCLSEIIIAQCAGSEIMTDKYRDRVRKAQTDLLNVRDLLDPSIDR